MNRSRTRPLTRLTVVLAAVAAALFGLVSPASAAPYCGITWGSLPESSGGASPAGSFVGNIRSGEHPCFDRLVVDIGAGHGFDDYSVRYVPEVRADGSGEVIPLRGDAYLEVVVQVPAYDEYGSTYGPDNPLEVVNTSGYSTFRQVAWGGSFEGYTTLGVGVRAHLPFRVLTLEGPGPWSRMVIDVAHRW